MIGSLEWYLHAGVVRWFAVQVFVGHVNVSGCGAFKPFHPMFLLCFVNPVA